MMLVFYYLFVPFLMYLIGKKIAAIGMLLMKGSFIMWIVLLLTIHYLENLLNIEKTNGYYLSTIGNEIYSMYELIINTNGFGNVVFNLYVMIPYLIIQKITILLLDVNSPFLFAWCFFISLLSLRTFYFGFVVFNNGLKSNVHYL